MSCAHEQYVWTLQLYRVMILPRAQRNILFVRGRAWHWRRFDVQIVVVRTSMDIEPIPSKMGSNAPCTIVPHVVALSQKQRTRQLLI